jgi:hypothetical protein
MIPASALTSTLMLLFGVITFILIMLLPAIIEMKKPKDAGPKILENDAHHGTNLLADIESYAKFDWTIVKRVAEIIATLPNLEH